MVLVASLECATGRARAISALFVTPSSVGLPGGIVLGARIGLDKISALGPHRIATLPCVVALVGTGVSARDYPVSIEAIWGPLTAVHLPGPVAFSDLKIGRPVCVHVGLGPRLEIKVKTPLVHLIAPWHHTYQAT